jgi:hypothetical protein
MTMPRPVHRAPLALASVLLGMLVASGLARALEAAATTVFDLQLGAPFAVRECQFETVTSEVGKEGVATPKRNRGLFGRPERIATMYRYTEVKPARDKCFQRVGPFYTSAPPAGLEPPPLAPPNNQKVKLVYADDLRPGLADAEDIWVGIQDGHLTGMRFYFQNRHEKAVLQALQRKFGAPTPDEKLTLPTGAGVVRSLYSATWEFANLSVRFLSLDTNQIGYDPQDAPLGDRSEVGSVTIQFKRPEKAREDKNQL